MLWSWTILYIKITTLKYTFLYVKYCKLHGAMLVFFPIACNRRGVIVSLRSYSNKMDRPESGDRGVLALHSQLPLSQTHCQQHISKPPKPTLQRHDTHPLLPRPGQQSAAWYWGWHVPSAQVLFSKGGC